MNKNDLTDTINRSIEELGFARIPRAALVDIFSTAETASFEVHDSLKDFANGEGLQIRQDSDEDFVVFERKAA